MARLAADRSNTVATLAWLPSARVMVRTGTRRSCTASPATCWKCSWVWPPKYGNATSATPSDQAQLQVDLAAFAAFQGLDVPLALLAPAVADRTQRRHQLIAVGVQGDGFPLGVVLLTEVIGEV